MALVQSYNDNDIAELARENQAMEAHVKNLQKENQALDRDIGDADREKNLLENALMISELKINKLKVYDRLNATKPDPEVAAKLTELRNRVKLEKRKHIKLLEAKGLSQKQFEEKTNVLRDMQASLENAKIKTNWAIVSKGPLDARDHHGYENKLRELNKTISRLEDEQKIQKALSAKKTACIEQLLGRVEELKKAEENLIVLKEEVKDVEAEKTNSLDELRTLQRIFHKKENLIKDLRKDFEVNDPQRIKQLESDKKVLQHEITKHADFRRSNEKTIQAQHYRLRSLDAKLQAISAALKSMKKPDIPEEEIMRYRPNVGSSAIERVEAYLFKEVQNELEIAREQIEAKDVLMMQKDVIIEVLEKKVEILTGARGVLEKKLRLESAGKEREKRELCTAIDYDEQAHIDTRAKLVNEKRDYDQLITSIQ